MTQTIFALATAAGRAAVAVMRISGPRAGDVLASLCRRPAPRRAAIRRLVYEGRLIVQALVLWMPGPASYTGEDCAELQIHGGRAVIDALSDVLEALGLRLAEPGEFTRRAFEAGKLDLAQAEAVGDLIDAQTAAQARQALQQLEGQLGRRYEAWRAGLIEALAMLEAAIDFPDEDLPAEVASAATVPLLTIQADLAIALADAERGRQVREGFHVAIIGAPNAGKSTLLNALAGREAAIVTATPGTTRDVIEIPLVLGGYQVLLADTAGLRDTADEIEAEGVRRAQAWAERAALRLWVIDSAASDGSWRAGQGLARPGDFAVLNKVDLAQGSDHHAAVADANGRGLDVLPVALTGFSGADAVGSALERRVTAALAAADFPASTRLRHRAALAEAADHLARALAEMVGAAAPELAAEDVRLAARALARITGRIEPDQVLDKVFSSFCIGK